MDTRNLLIQLISPIQKWISLGTQRLSNKQCFPCRILRQLINPITHSSQICLLAELQIQLFLHQSVFKRLLRITQQFIHFIPRIFCSFLDALSSPLRFLPRSLRIHQMILELLREFPKHRFRFFLFSTKQFDDSFQFLIDISTDLFRSSGAL